jgi:hypothetical protein
MSFFSGGEKNINRALYRHLGPTLNWPVVVSKLAEHYLLYTERERVVV